ncbi:hypothetical protein [Dyadobacter aurulentus]|uniref:hypothetical protein n=1 Tax=Dyadobacter sp. UC 10 TaxID=2605428 RepID=UPI0011F151D7|nr:hypothetical protein [Dyadobacter sp. UC 10]KAA0992836.1 hypothetical protein FXO21_23000 [Dyadobacter sp. UC 10]
MLLILFSGCDDDTPEKNGEVEKALIANKDNFLKGLNATDRFWRFETLTIQYRDSSSKINFHDTAITAIPWEVLDGPVHNISLRFYGSSVKETISSGPYGDVDYPTNRTMWSTVMGLTEDGTCGWDEQKQTVTMVVPGSIRSIIRAASQKRFMPLNAHLESVQPLLYTSLSDALQAASPERVSVVLYEENSQLGKVKYTLSLRGAWIRETTPGGRQAFHKVTY